MKFQNMCQSDKRQSYNDNKGKSARKDGHIQTMNPDEKIEMIAGGNTTVKADKAIEYMNSCSFKPKLPEAPCKHQTQYDMVHLCIEIQVICL